MSAVHICSFAGKRAEPVKPIWCVDQCGRVFDAADYPPSNMRCDGEGRGRGARQGQCTRMGTTGVIFVWGAMWLCDECAEKECGPKPPASPPEPPPPPEKCAQVIVTSRSRRRGASE